MRFLIHPLQMAWSVRRQTRAMQECHLRAGEEKECTRKREILELYLSSGCDGYISQQILFSQKDKKSCWQVNY